MGQKVQSEAQTLGPVGEERVGEADLCCPGGCVWSFPRGLRNAERGALEKSRKEVGLKAEVQPTVQPAQLSSLIPLHPHPPSRLL